MHMETINNIELRNPEIFPSEDILETLLGKSFPAYLELLNLFGINELVYEWRYYFDGKAWLCKVQKKNKTIVWMSAWEGYIQATIYFPEKYLDNIYGLKINESTKEKIRQTKNVGKSKPCIFEIKNKKILKDFNEVMQFKIKCK